MRNEYEELLRM